MLKTKVPSVLFAGAGLAGLLAAAGDYRVQAADAGAPITRNQMPRLYPDYTGIVLPPNIAPLNFRVEEPGVRYRVEMRSTQGAPIVITTRSPAVEIPLKAWGALLRAHAGEPLYWDISVQNPATGWTRFQTVTNLIAREEIDGHLVYRLLKPLYNTYQHLGSTSATFRPLCSGQCSRIRSSGVTV